MFGNELTTRHSQALVVSRSWRTALGSIIFAQSNHTKVDKTVANHSPIVIDQ